jgi:hypothetical protein
VAEAVGRRYELGGFIQAIHFYPSGRWTGDRQSEAFVGVAAITSAAGRSWLNGHPRPPGQLSLHDATN